MPDSKSIAVVVVMYNSAVHLPALIKGFPGATSRVITHLVFVDNASRDESVALARQLAPDATVVETGRNGGYAAGINAGVAASPNHDAVLILNPDVAIDEDCIAELAAGLDCPGVGITVPRLLNGEGQLIRSLRREPTLGRALGDTLLGTRWAGRFSSLGEFVTDERAYREAGVADWAEGSVQMVSRECWRKVGGWDESFFLYSEEVEYDLRARDAGFALRYVPTATARHLQGDSRVSPGLRRLVVLNRVRYFRRRQGTARAVLFWLIVVLREATRSLLRRESARAALLGLLSPGRWRQRPGPEAVIG